MTSYDQLTTSLLDALFEHPDEFIGLFDRTRQGFVRVNATGKQLLFPPEQHGDALGNVPDLDGFWRENDEALLARDGFIEREVALRHPDGRAFRACVHVRPVDPPADRLLLVRISDREPLHRMEQQLEHSARRYEAVFSTATIAIIVSDRSGRIVSVNPQARRLFGYTDDDLVGQFIEVLVPDAVGRRHEALRDAFMENPEVRSMGHNRDLHARRRDGSVFPVEVSLGYFHLDDELFVVSYAVDITFKKEAERALIEQNQRIERLNADLEQKVTNRTHALMTTLEQLEQSKDELAKALAAERELGELKSRFVSMASHEFRTPLTAVLTSASLIEKYPTTEQQDKRQKHLDRIRSSVNHLNDILEEFLSVGRLEEGRVEARPSRFRLDALVRDVVADLHGMLKAGQTIETDLDCGADLWLDQSLLRKILVNLLSNAIKYSPEHRTVRVKGTCGGGQLRLTVIDQGIGISPDDQERLFERFFRAKNATNIQGTGLGLHIVGRYVELLGGRVELASELNRGTTVTLFLPYENHPPH